MNIIDHTTFNQSHNYNDSDLMNIPLKVSSNSKYNMPKERPYGVCLKEYRIS